jgi:hypothetical protein
MAEARVVCSMRTLVASHTASSRLTASANTFFNISCSRLFSVSGISAGPGNRAASIDHIPAQRIAGNAPVCVLFRPGVACAANATGAPPFPAAGV